MGSSNGSAESIATCGKSTAIHPRTTHLLFRKVSSDFTVEEEEPLTGIAVE
jgi:hypothetical protein